MVWSEAKGQVRHLQCSRDGTDLSDLPRTLGRPWSPSARDFADALPLVRVLRLSEIPEASAANSAAFGSRATVNDEKVPMVTIGAPDEWPSHHLDARTGKDLTAPK